MALLIPPHGWCALRRPPPPPVVATALNSPLVHWAPVLPLLMLCSMALPIYWTMFCSAPAARTMLLTMKIINLLTLNFCHIVVGIFVLVIPIIGLNLF